MVTVGRSRPADSGSPYGGAAGTSTGSGRAPPASDEQPSSHGAEHPASRVSSTRNAHISKFTVGHSDRCGEGSRLRLALGPVGDRHHPPGCRPPTPTSSETRVDEGACSVAPVDRGLTGAVSSMCGRRPNRPARPPDAVPNGPCARGLAGGGPSPRTRAICAFLGHVGTINPLSGRATGTVVRLRNKALRTGVAAAASGRGCLVHGVRGQWSRCRRAELAVPGLPPRGRESRSSISDLHAGPLPPTSGVWKIVACRTSQPDLVFSQETCSGIAAGRRAWNSSPTAPVGDVRRHREPRVRISKARLPEPRRRISCQGGRRVARRRLRGPSDPRRRTTCPGADYRPPASAFRVASDAFDPHPQATTARLPPRGGVPAGFRRSYPRGSTAPPRAIRPYAGRQRPWRIPSGCIPVGSGPVGGLEGCGDQLPPVPAAYEAGGDALAIGINFGQRQST
jgi:hypothetical protein